MTDMEESKRPTSLHATIKQGGAQGSALDRLNKASAIKKNRNEAVSPPTLSRENSERDAISTSIQLEEDIDSAGQITFDDMFTQADSDDEGEFDIVNPLYEHAGSGGRFRTGTLRPPEIGLSVQRITTLFKSKSRTPTGRVEFLPIKAEGLSSPTRTGNALSVRVRASLNGCSAATGPGTCSSGAAPKFSSSARLTIWYYKAEVDPSDPLQTQDIGELQIEINDVSDDSFVGAATISDITKITSPKRVTLELTSEQGTCAAGTLEVELCLFPIYVY